MADLKWRYLKFKKISENAFRQFFEAFSFHATVKFDKLMWRTFNDLEIVNSHLSKSFYIYYYVNTDSNSISSELLHEEISLINFIVKE